METMWLKEVLFAGAGADAFKLGTVLTLGWFWLRVAGCSVLYRGSSMERIEFANILVVAEASACLMSPPGYVQHESGSTYFYVIRRANSCGQQEHTLSAAVKVSIDADGNLASPQPNSIFGARAQRVAGSKILLVWYYCSVEQKSKPACFNVYYDSGTGHIDYENPVASIRYVGRRFYGYQSGTLDADRYLFAIRAEDANGTENRSLASIGMELDTTSPEGVDILSTEVV